LHSVVFQIIVPQIFVSRILEEVRDSPSGKHFGVNKIWKKIGRNFIGLPVSRITSTDAKVVESTLPKSTLQTRRNLLFYNVEISPFERLQNILEPLQFLLQ